MKFIISNINSKDPENEYLLGEGIFLIGRSPENDIPLNDSFISRQHAELSVSDGIAVIEDLGSRNKTFVNGKAIKRTILKNRDKIQIGNYNLEFIIDTFVEKETDNKTSITTVFKADDNPLFTRESDYLDKSELLLAHQKLIALYKIGNIINTTLKTDELLGKILDSIFEVMNADRVSILVWDDELNDFKISIARSRDKRNLASEIQFSRTIFEEAFINNKAVLTLDAHDDERFQSGKSIIIQNIHSAMCVPISIKDHILGVIYADTHQLNRIFSNKDLQLLSAIAIQAGIAMENARLYSELEELFLSAISSLASAIEAKDPYTKGHSERVSYLSTKLAEKVGLTPKECDDTRLAGLLHDIGKIGIHESILNKPGKIDEGERKIIETHPSMSYDIIIKMRGLDYIAEVAKHHHERLDGKGYPDQLKNDEIPFISRILAIADIYDALTSDRIYRKKLKPQEALDYLRQNVGTIFDGSLVSAFCEIINNMDNSLKCS